ncbi:hypothetical protein ABIB06_006546 [Bradyrhizobium sp. LB8.2]|uniref:GTA-gp10 family protein n=1 Tax=unclassified Bradyrhizobium TaxID=2631580 RepID=UPI003399E5F6
MSERLRNEYTITLKGEEHVMRATFGAIRGIERDLKTNIIPLLMRLEQMGLEQAAIIVWHGLKGYGDTAMTLDDVGEAILDIGLDNPDLMTSIVKFAGHALKGAEMGKPQKAPAE